MHSLAQLVLALLAGSAGKAFVKAINIPELEDYNIDSVLDGKSALVEFWAPGCEPCKDLEPTYQELADIYEHHVEKFVIAKVNGDTRGGKSLVKKYQITTLPTIKYIHSDGVTEDYDPEAPRSLEDLATFVKDRSRLRSMLPAALPPHPPVTTELTLDNFDKIVNDPEKDVLVAFTTTWCGHCKAMMPLYDLVAWWFRSEKHVVVANLPGAADVNQDLAKKYGVTKFPIVKLFPKGSSNKEPIKFQASDDEKNLVDFMNRHAGTQRAVGGGLTDEAGRSAQFDHLAAQFMAAAPSERKKLYEKTKTATSAEKSGEQYLRIMDKLVNGTDDYLGREKARLSGILQKRKLSDEKIDEIKIKSNVLSAFVAAAAKRVDEDLQFELFAEEIDEKTTETEMKRVKEEL